jgi:hypothetical protein
VTSVPFLTPRERLAGSEAILTTRAELRLNIADADVLISGPKGVVDVVDRMLEHVSRQWSSANAPLQILVEFDSEMWRVSGAAPAGRKVLGRLSALPQVAGAVISSLLAELAFHRNFNVWRAAVVEHDGQALVMIGDDWESCVTITAHLHTRGWRILGGDYALVSGDTLVVTAFKKVLHANSSCIASFPLWYRRAIEASPWYSTSQAIAFYAIDPTLVEGPAAWGERAPLRAVLKVDGLVADHPSLETVAEFNFPSGFARNALTRAGIEIASLVLGEYIETCDLLEKWFGRLPAAELTL